MASVSENITAGADDVYTYQFGGTYYFISNLTDIRAGTAYSYQLGVRFQTVNVPQGATIDLATLTTKRSATVQTPDPKWYGDDVDDAAAWSASNAPRHITKTTANVSVDIGPGTVVHTITSIVQEIVNRGGWTANADMRFIASSGLAGKVWAIYAYEKSQADAAVLDITYTEDGGPPPTISLVMAPHTPT